MVDSIDRRPIPINVADLPRLNIELGYDPSFTIRKIGRIPQSRFLTDLYGDIKLPNGVFHTLDNWTYRMSDDVLDRVITKEQPLDIDEEEILRLSRLRDSMTYLGWMALGRSALPDEVKRSFSPRAGKEHLSYEGYESAGRKVANWAREHPQDDKPLRLTPTMRVQVLRMHSKIQKCLEFWNTNGLLLDFNKAPRSEYGFALVTYANEAERKRLDDKGTNRRWILDEYLYHYGPFKRYLQFRRHGS